MGINNLAELNFETLDSITFERGIEESQREEMVTLVMKRKLRHHCLVWIQKVVLSQMDTILATIYIFRSENIFKGFNAIHLCLIPKSHSPSVVRDFRPISLCNVLYKAVAKIIANRLLQLIPKVVSLTNNFPSYHN